eukprot:NODE_10_length_47437_cov_0.363429.p1 type:complete len:1206 gc:universal NODE_10_length_47437_cov_0.363429:13687-10070(-)
MLLHFIKSNLFEVFYLLTKDNEVIDKMVSYGHITDIFQNLAFVFYKTIPWNNKLFQLLCSCLTVSVSNSYLSTLTFIFVLWFLCGFSHLCYQVHSSGGIYTANLLKVTRYQYGILSTMLYFPTVEQLLTLISLKDPGSIITIGILVFYTCLVSLGSFLLFSPNPDPRNHSSRNCQKVDAFEILFKTFVAIGFSSFEPIVGCWILVIGWTFLYVTSFYLPAFYNHSSNMIRSGAILALDVCSFIALLICYNENLHLPFYACYLVILVFVITSCLGMLIYSAYNQSRKIPSNIYLLALKFNNSKSLKHRIQLKNAIDEWVSLFWNPYNIVAYTRTLSSLVFSKKRYAHISQIKLYHGEENEYDDFDPDLLVKKVNVTDTGKPIEVNATLGNNKILNQLECNPPAKSNAEADNVTSSSVRRSSLDLESNNHVSRPGKLYVAQISLASVEMENKPGLNIQDKLVKQLNSNFENCARLICLQMFECGKKKFINSTWLKAQYLIFLECSNSIFPNLKIIPNLMQNADLILNQTFLEEKTIDVHYILFSFYKKRLFEKASKSNITLKNVVDIVAYSHDRDIFIESIDSVVTSTKLFTNFLEKDKISTQLLISFAADIQSKWYQAKLYLKKSLIRVPTSFDLLSLYRESCIALDLNSGLAAYLITVSNNLEINGDISELEMLMEKHRRSLFHTPDHLPKLVAKLYRNTKMFFTVQFSTSLPFFVIFFLLVVFYIKSQAIYYQSANAAAMTYGITVQSGFVRKFSYDFFQDPGHLAEYKETNIKVQMLWKGIVTANVYSELRVSPFAAKVLEYENGNFQNISFEESNYDLQWKANKYLQNKSESNNLERNLPRYQSDFYKFWIDIQDQSSEILSEKLFLILAIFGVVFLIKLSLMLPIFIHFYKGVKSDLEMDAQTFEYSENAKKFDDSLNRLKSLSQQLKGKTAKESHHTIKTVDIFKTLKLKFYVIIILYAVCLIIVYFVYKDAQDTENRYFEAKSWVYARTYFDNTVTSSSSYYVKSMNLNYTIEEQKFAFTAMQQEYMNARDLAAELRRGESTGYISVRNNTSPIDYWNQHNVMKYFGNGCMDSRYCGSPALGHNSILRGTRHLFTLNHLVWSNAIIKMQLKLVHVPEYEASQNAYLALIDSEFESRYSTVTIICYLMIAACTVLLLAFFKTTMYTINKLCHTHNRVKLLKSICSNHSNQVLTSSDVLNK